MTNTISGGELGQLILDGRPLEKGEAIQVFAGDSWWEAKVTHTAMGWRLHVPDAKPTSILRGLGMAARRMAAA